MLSRRHLLASPAATTASLAVSDVVLPVFGDVARNTEAEKFNASRATFFQEHLTENPESATQLGLRKGVNAGLKAKLRCVAL